MKKRIFIQGDSEPTGKICDMALEIGKLLKQAGYEANVGAYGGFVKIIQNSGITIYPHEMDTNRATQYEGVAAVNCISIAQEIFGRDDGFSPAMLKSIAWGIRMGLFLATSDGFLFFHGQQGTLAHLAPVLAHAIKGWVKNSQPRQIALVGWPVEDSAAVMKLFNISRGADWFGMFNESDPPQKIVDFLKI